MEEKKIPPKICPLCGQSFTNSREHWEESHRGEIDRDEFYNLVLRNFASSRAKVPIPLKKCHLCGEEVKSLKLHHDKCHTEVDYWDYIWDFMGNPVCQVCGKELKGPQYGHHSNRSKPPRSCCASHENVLRYREGTLNSNTAFGGPEGRLRGIRSAQKRGTWFGGDEVRLENCRKSGRKAVEMGRCFGGPDRTNALRARSANSVNPNYPVRVYILECYDVINSTKVIKVGMSGDLRQRKGILSQLNYKILKCWVTEELPRSRAREIEKSIHSGGFKRFPMDSRRRSCGIGSNGPREWYYYSELSKIQDKIISSAGGLYDSETTSCE